MLCKADRSGGESAVLREPDTHRDPQSRRLRAPVEGVRLVHPASARLCCERIVLVEGLAICRVEGRCETGMRFDAPSADESRLHLQYLAQGECEFAGADSSWVLSGRAPTLITAPSGQAAWRTPAQRALHVVSIDVTGVALRRWFAEAAEGLLPHGGRDLLRRVASGRSQGLLQRLSNMLQADFDRGALWRLQLESMVLESLLDCFERRAAASSERRYTTLERRCLRRVREMLAEDLAPPATMTAVAVAVGMPLRRLQRLFRESTGTELKVALAEARFRAARDALLRGDLSIKQIAWQNGFTHATSFTHAFRKRYGMPPSALTSRRQRGD